MRWIRAIAESYSSITASSACSASRRSASQVQTRTQVITVTLKHEIIRTFFLKYHVVYKIVLFDWPEAADSFSITAQVAVQIQMIGLY